MQGRILIVDDDAVVRTVVQRILHREGLDADAAQNGREAQERLAGTEYDVAIIDLQMPDIDGFALLAWMQEHGQKTIPIVLSGTEAIQDALRAVQEGAFDFIAKPIEAFDAFLQHIRHAIDHKRLRDSHEQLLHELQAKNIELETRLGQLALAHNILQSQAVAIQVDLGRAMRIQHGLLPQMQPFPDRLCAAAFYRPMAKVGGDLYDLFRLDDRHLGLYIADTSGHGVSSAMLTVFLKHAMQGLIERVEDGAIRPPGAVLSDLNQTIITEAFGQGVFVSMTYLILDVDTMRATYSSAGHPPLLLQRRGGPIERLHRPAPVLGVNPNVRYTESEFSLHPGDLLMLYTDGIPEARNAAGEFFGEERLKQILAAIAPHADASVEAVEKKLAAFTEGCPRTDDITLVALSIEPQRTPFHAPEEEPLRTPATVGGVVKVLMAREDQRTFISICGTGSWRESQQILGLCEQARKSGEHSIILDFSNCPHLDSTFLGVLHNIVTSFDRARETEGTACRIEVQNLPALLLREMSELGLTSVLIHFRPEPAPLPDSMRPVEGGIPGDEDLGRLLLWAHEALVEADPSNADRFAAVLQVLHDRAKNVAAAPHSPAETKVD